MKMKHFGLTTILLLCLSNTIAGDHDEKLRIAKQVVVETYTHGLEGEWFEMSAEHDIWNVELYEGGYPDCEWTVTGHAHKPTGNGSTIDKFWICITKDANGKYVGELTDEVQIANE